MSEMEENDNEVVVQSEKFLTENDGNDTQSDNGGRSRYGLI